MYIYLHLLNRFLATGLFSTDDDAVADDDRSSKLIIIKLISSTSLLIGAITSEHRNFSPIYTKKVCMYKIYKFWSKQVLGASVSCE